MQSDTNLAGCRAETAKVYRQAVERTIDSMGEHLAEDFSLEDMARIGYMSPYHFNRVFRQVTGVPPMRFLGARRLEMAKRLLLTTSMSVTDVCFEVGYNSLGTFTRRFTDLMGLPPNRFRTLVGGDRGSGARARTWSKLESDRQPSGIRGQLRIAPELVEDFDGLIFIGLFKTAIPQGCPIAYTTRRDPGPYSLPRVEDGRYYLCAIGLPSSSDLKSYFLYEKALRAGQPDQPLVVKGGQIEGSTDLELRHPRPFDPPILTTLPLIAEQDQEKGEMSFMAPMSKTLDYAPDAVA